MDGAQDVGVRLEGPEHVILRPFTKAGHKHLEHRKWDNATRKMQQNENGNTKTGKVKNILTHKYRNGTRSAHERNVQIQRHEQHTQEHGKP